jgi:hypothetical protein
MRARAPRLMHLDDAIERDVVFCGVLETPSDKLGVHTTGALAATSVAPHGKNVLLIACGDRLSPHLHTHHAAAAVTSGLLHCLKNSPPQAKKVQENVFFRHRTYFFLIFWEKKVLQLSRL